MKSYALLFVALTMFSGCAATQAPKPVAVVAQDHGNTYAAALSEAFDRYEAEVRTASALTYASQAEAEAVMRTFSPERLDLQLREALARRQLTLSGFAAYAQSHADFFHAQQRRHWGRLAQIQHTVDSIALRVQPSDDQLASLSAAQHD